jgi:hypothetical protein
MGGAHTAKYNLLARPQQLRRLFERLPSGAVLVSYGGSKGISLSQDILNHWQIHIDILTHVES